MIGEGAVAAEALGAADRARVSDYLDSVREIEQRVQRLATSKSMQMDLPNAPLGAPDEFGELLDAQFEMIALAWQTNQTRVASFMLAKEVSMRTYPNLQITEPSIRCRTTAEIASKIERLVQIQNYHTQVFAKFIKKLSDHAGWRRHAARPFDHPVRQQHGATATCTTTIRCPTWSWAGLRTASRAASTCNIRRTRRTRTSCSRCWTAPACRCEKLGNSTGTFAEV